MIDFLAFLTAIAIVQAQKPYPSCTTLVCPTGFQYKSDAASRTCTRPEPCDVGYDREACCDQLCSNVLKCPIFWIPKPDRSSLPCSELCDLEEDVPNCCDQAATCASYDCPPGFVPKPDFPPAFCSDLTCDEDVDLENCCDLKCSNFTCPTGSRPKENIENITCAGVCDPLRDRGTCCDLVLALNSSAQLLRATVVSDSLKVDRLVAMRTPIASKSTGFHTGHFDGAMGLHYAVLRGDIGIVARLVEAGHDVNAVDVRGWSALHIAAGRGHVDIVTRLLQLGANPVLANHDDDIARDVARKSMPDSSRLEVVLARGERQWLEGVHQDGFIDAPTAMLRRLPVQRGLRAWLAADAQNCLKWKGGALLQWADQSGQGNHAEHKVDSEKAPQTMGSIRGMPAVRFHSGETLSGSRAASCKTVAVVMQHLTADYLEDIFFSEAHGEIYLRLSDHLNGYWRDNRSLTGPGLSPHDWQYRQTGKLWLNGDDEVSVWPGFPTSPVVVIAVMWESPFDGLDFFYRLGGWRGFDGLLGEVLTFDRELDESEVLEVNAYLATKWGIPFSPAMNSTVF